MPTTARPVTEPPRKASRRAVPIPVLAAWVVRQLARVDTYMPMTPMEPEQITPKR